MRVILDDYYSGHEGMPQIDFVRKSGGDEIIFTLWDGYFEAFMNAVRPTADGWNSLAKYYHLHEGWYDESDWHLDDPVEALIQLSSIKEEDLPDAVRLIWSKVLEFFRQGIALGDRFSIRYD